MRTKWLAAGLVLAGILLSAGCSTRIGDFSVITTGAPQYRTMDKAPIVQTVGGSDGRAWLLFIPLGKAPRIDEALDVCLDKANGDFMERARIYYRRWSIILFSYGGYTVVGDVGNSRGGSGKASAARDDDADESVGR